MSKAHTPSITAITKALLRSKHAYRWRDLPSFIGQTKEFARLGGKIDGVFPILFERLETAGSATGHYFHQDLLVANFIHKDKPQRHLDVGSRIDGFVAHVAAFMPVDVLDVRPLPSTGHSNIQFIQADLMGEMDPNWTEQYDSISCLHAIEHFGLGRYGDSLDPQGHIKGFQNLLKLLKPGGKLYISFPIATETVIEFNAHRKFNPIDIVNWPTNGNQIHLKRFDYVDDTGDLHQDVSLLTQSLKLNYGCGIYTFQKSTTKPTCIDLPRCGNQAVSLPGPCITFQMDPDNAEGAGSFYQRPFLAYLFAQHQGLPFIHTQNRHSDVHYSKSDALSINRDLANIFEFLGKPTVSEQPYPCLALDQPVIAEHVYHLTFDTAYAFISSLDDLDRERLLASVRNLFRSHMAERANHLIPTKQNGTTIALHLRDRSSGDPTPSRKLLPWQMFSVDYGLPDNNPRYYAKLYANAVNSIVAEHQITKPILQIHSTGKEESFRYLQSLLNPKIEIQFFLNSTSSCILLFII
jgi:SAM-dependent methyltransferase